MSRAWVAYGTKHGSTRLIAERIGDCLRRNGFEVTVRPADESVDRSEGLDLVVLGGALYIGRWHRSARRFLRRHREDLAGVPVAVFGSGPLGPEPAAWNSSRRQLDRTLRRFAWLRPVAVTVFGGADPPGRSTARDLRDWDAVERWAAELPGLTGSSGLGDPDGSDDLDERVDRRAGMVPADAGPARRYRRGGGHRVENLVMRLPVRWGWLPGTYVLTTVGRRSGQRRTTMVTVVRSGDRRWLVAPYGEVGWVHNARAAGRVELTRRGRTEALAVREVDAQEAGPVLRRYVHQARVTQPYFVAGPDDPVERFVQEAGAHPVFELVAQPTPPGS